MRQIIKFVILTLFCFIPTLAYGQAGSERGFELRNRFEGSIVEPDGFLGIRLGNTMRYAEDLFGEPDVIRNGSREWRFRTADFDPYEGLTVLGDNGQIIGFIAHLRANRIRFSDMSLDPEKTRFDTYYSTRKYTVGKYVISLLVVGDDDVFVRRITLSAKKQ